MAFCLQKCLLIAVSLFLPCLPGGSDGKVSTCSAGNLDLIPGSERSPREGNGYPLQYSCLENSMNRGAQWATVHGVKKNWTQLSHVSCLPLGSTYMTIPPAWLARDVSS